MHRLNAMILFILVTLPNVSASDSDTLLLSLPLALRVQQDSDAVVNFLWKNAWIMSSGTHRKHTWQSPFAKSLTTSSRIKMLRRGRVVFS